MGHLPHRPQPHPGLGLPYRILDISRKTPVLSAIQGLSTAPAASGGRWWHPAGFWESGRALGSTGQTSSDMHEPQGPFNSLCIARASLGHTAPSWALWEIGPGPGHRKAGEIVSQSGACPGLSKKPWHCPRSGRKVRQPPSLLQSRTTAGF